MITLNKQPGQRVLELGGGSNPNPASDVNVDVRMMPGVHFTCDFNGPLPINGEEFDHVFSHFLLEHVSYRNVPALLKEIYRVLKPGGMTVHAVPNTAAQIEWLRKNPRGWDGRNLFESASGCLFGDQDYPENSHRCYFDTDVIQDLFEAAGFADVKYQPYGERKTDMVVSAVKPGIVRVVNDAAVAQTGQERVPGKHEDVAKQLAEGVQSANLGNPKQPAAIPPMSREEMFDKHYFNGGGKVGGYAREGYWDYPVHEVTARKILERKPESVLELGCARGYVLKRIQDAGVQAAGYEISKHCYMTRVADNVRLADLCKTPWHWNGYQYDLCYSIATLEHVPEEHLANVIKEMTRVSKRGLHGVDFGHNDDGFDKTHTTLRPKDWWQHVFATVAPGYPVEIVDKEELEKGEFPKDVAEGDGRIKLNVGSFTTMYHHGWLNIDVHDLAGWSQQFGYRYMRHDVRNGLPFSTGVVDRIMACHFLEHLSYDDGLKFLRECRRVLRPDGAMRIIVPDANLLTWMYHKHFDRADDFGCNTEFSLRDMGEINDGCAKAKTAVGKLWALLHEGHHAAYDTDTLGDVLCRAGFSCYKSSFRAPITEVELPALQQIRRETFDTFPCLSLYMNATPDIG